MVGAIDKDLQPGRGKPSGDGYIICSGSSTHRKPPLLYDSLSNLLLLLAFIN